MPFIKGHKINIGNKFAKKHGFDNTPFCNVYRGMKLRCKNKNMDSYKYYGGRGIEVEWESFEEFHQDMYESYLEHVKKFGEKNTTIDRTDVNGNYSRKNCRWATKKEQGRNKSNNRFITFNGKTQTLSAWAEETGLHKCTIRSRLNSPYWSLQKTLTTKSKKQNANFS